MSSVPHRQTFIRRDVRTLRTVAAFISPLKPPSFGFTTCSPVARWLTELAREPTDPTLYPLIIKEPEDVSCVPMPIVVNPGQREVHRLIRTTRHGDNAVLRYLTAASWWLTRPPVLPLDLRIHVLALQSLSVELATSLTHRVQRLAISARHPDPGARRQLFEVRLPFQKQKKAKVTDTCTNIAPQDLMEMALHAVLVLHHLEELHLSGFDTYTLDLRRLANVRKLKRFTVVGAVTLANLDCIGELLPALEELTIHRVRGLTSLAPLASCMMLRQLDVSHVGVDDLAPLAQCPALEVIQCSALLHPTRVNPGVPPTTMKTGAQLMLSVQLPVSLAPLGSAARLKELVVLNCTIVSLGGLAACQTLEKLTIRCCDMESTVVCLEGVSALREVELYGIRVTTVEFLHGGQNVERLRVSRCASLFNLAGLQRLRRLRVLDVSQSGVRSLGDLNTCVCLEEVDASQCHSLVDISGLNGSPSLRTLNARQTAVTELGTFACCTSLEEVDVSHCRSVTSLEAFAGAPRLRVLRARHTDTLRLGDLGQCPALEYLDVQYAAALTALDGLQGARRLRLLDIESTAVSSLEPLRALPALEQLNASGCGRLTSIEPLRGAPCLQSISLRQTRVTDFNVLKTCPALREVYWPSSEAQPRAPRADGPARWRTCTQF